MAIVGHKFVESFKTARDSGQFSYMKVQKRRSFAGSITTHSKTEKFLVALATARLHQCANLAPGEPQAWEVSDEEHRALWKNGSRLGYNVADVGEGELVVLVWA